MASPTQAMRNAWADYDGNEGAMQRISFGPDSILVAPPTIDAWKALERVLEAFGYGIRIEDTDSYNDRQIKGGGGKSLHAYGIALDINWHTNPYRDHAGKRPGRFSAKTTQAERAEDVRLGIADTDMTKQMTDAVLAIQTLGGKRVFGWGGTWETLKDSMHFQIEVTPTELAKGIDWNTVVGGRQEGEIRDRVFDDIRDRDPDIIFDDPLDESDFRPGGETTVAVAEGDSGALVTALQNGLKDLNYPVGAIDGIFGTMTRDAVLAFQATNGLPTTGIADADTFNALNNGRRSPVSFQRVSATEQDLQKKGSRTINAAGWGRWLGYATSILGGLGLVDSQGHFVSGLGDILKGSTAGGGQITPDLLADAIRKALEAAPAGTTPDKLATLAQDAIPKIIAAGGDTAAGGGGILGPIISLAQGLLGSGGWGPWGIAIALGYFVVRNANTAASARLSDHRTGANRDR
jgi:peptidoglycan hydrolase-like protein with peptidoglycan-binding domain